MPKPYIATIVGYSSGASLGTLRPPCHHAVNLSVYTLQLRVMALAKSTPPPLNTIMARVRVDAVMVWVDTTRVGIDWVETVRLPAARVRVHSARVIRWTLLR